MFFGMICMDLHNYASVCCYHLGSACHVARFSSAAFRGPTRNDCKWLVTWFEKARGTLVFELAQRQRCMSLALLVRLGHVWTRHCCRFPKGSWKPGHIGPKALSLHIRADRVINSCLYRDQSHPIDELPGCIESKVRMPCVFTRKLLMTTSSMALSWTIRSHFFDRMVLSCHGRVRCSGITQDGCSDTYSYLLNGWTLKLF